MSTTKVSDKAAWAPFLVEPTFKQAPWGVSDLRPWFNWFDSEGSGERRGEVCVLSDDSVITTGVHKGKKLGELCASNPKEMFGDAAPAKGLPLLKLLFTGDKMSVQVHPDDAVAKKHGAKCGKDECWYVCTAEENAQIGLGLKSGVTLDQVRKGAADGSIEQMMEFLPVKPRDMVRIDAGTVHAAGAGLAMLELQTNVDITYRLYDYGSKRELHVDKALEAIKLDSKSCKNCYDRPDYRFTLFNGQDYRIERVSVPVWLESTGLRAGDKPGLQMLFAVFGRFQFVSQEFPLLEGSRGGVVVVPAACPEFRIEDLHYIDMLRITLR
jgi:mannose-6-phosphate isomerase